MASSDDYIRSLLGVSPLQPRNSLLDLVAPTSALWPTPIGTLGNVLATAPPTTKRRAYFAFHFDDIMRVNNVRNAWKIDHPDHAIYRSFQDSSLWERRQLEGDDAIKQLIREGVQYTSAVCVLAGTDTWNRRWVRYEIARAIKAREAIGQQIADLDRKVLRLARNNAQVRRFMTAPGVGPITALCFLATIDDPTRFRRSRSVGAYAGLTTRRYASGEIDWTGQISKCGDKMLRSYLHEAANVLLTRVAKWSALKSWGMRVAKRSSLRKAKVAVARKLAVILHRMWIDGTEFKWSSKEAANQPA